jgi:signal transduction histidine kinase
LDVERFSVWCSTPDRRAIRLYFLYCRSANSVSDGTILDVEDFPSYFGALDGRTISIADTETDTAARDLLVPYLRPLGICALLDAPLYSEGLQVGLVCHEHVGGPRAWTPEEQLFVGTVADNVARLLEALQRQRAEQSLRAYRDELRTLTRLEGISRIAAGVAHDIRNVLTVVRAHADLAESELPGGNIREALAAIRAATERGRALAGELLEFGRDETRRPSVQSLHEFVGGVIKAARPSLGECEVHVRQTGEVSRVFIDPSDLERLLLNLFFNARDAMHGRGVIRVELSQAPSVKHSPSLGRAVRLSVCDQGEGMDADTRLRIFEPFFTRKPEGTGLGLCIVSQIVTRAGGVIEVESELGAGACFHVYLPAID